MCLCNNVNFGTYEVSIPVWYDARKRVVGIDLCLVTEILSLWKKGIDTVESCCGHNKTTGFIAVNEIHISKMIDLGYKLDVSTNAKGCFLPKEILNENEKP